MITAEPFIICSRCSKRTPCYYNDYSFSGKICGNCLVELHNGDFPKGKGVDLPCDRCQAPNIRWYHRETYGVIFNDCGNHGNHGDHDNHVNHINNKTKMGFNIESDDDASFDWNS